MIKSGGVMDQFKCQGDYTLLILVSVAFPGTFQYSFNFNIKEIFPPENWEGRLGYYV